jgi:hypothetical protein
MIKNYLKVRAKLKESCNRGLNTWDFKMNGESKSVLSQWIEFYVERLEDLPKYIDTNYIGEYTISWRDIEEDQNSFSRSPYHPGRVQS